MATATASVSSILARLTPVPSAHSFTVSRQRHYILIDLVISGNRAASLTTRVTPNDHETDVEEYRCHINLPIEDTQLLHDALYAMARLA